MPAMEDPIEKNMRAEMETGFICGLEGLCHTNAKQIADMSHSLNSLKGVIKGII